nr:hypothetical protein [Tanacetum cinerariifolium]
MRRVGKGFSGIETPLFEGMIVAHQADDVADEGAIGVDVDVVPTAAVEPSIPSPTPNTQPPPPSQELLSTSHVIPTPPPSPITTEIEKDANVQGRLEESQAQIYQIDLEHADKVLSMQDDDATITAATTLITAAIIIDARRRKRVVIRDPKVIATPSIIIHSEPKSKDKEKGIMVEEPKPLKKQAQIEQDEAYARELEALKRKLQTKSQARKNMMNYLRNMVGFKMDYFKGMSYDDIRLIFEKYFNSNVAFLEKTKEQLEEEESRALKRKTESSKEKVAKKHKLDEEVEKLKKHLQIVPIMMMMFILRLHLLL